MEKEYLYVGYYIDINGNFILKIGTTNDLKRRRTEHNRNYKKSPNYTMPKDSNFEYLWSHKLSKYNTLRYEDRNRDLWKEMEIGEFVRNDRFVLCKMPNFVPIKIRKTYQIALCSEGNFLCILPIDFLSRSCMGHTTGISCQQAISTIFAPIFWLFCLLHFSYNVL